MNDISDLSEPILAENETRFSLFPIKYYDIWELYKKSVAVFWTVEEISFKHDLVDWATMSKDHKFFIKHVLGFFSSFDGIINENLVNKFYMEIQQPEVRSFYTFQMCMETIHGEAYALMIDAFADDENEKNELFESIKNYPAIKKISKWALNWSSSDKTFDERLIAFGCIEGIMFSGAFCSIFHLKKQGLLTNGLCFSNELISRDEYLHTIMASLIHGHIVNKTSESRALEIMLEAVELQKEFIVESLPCSLLGMNSNDMSKYIEFVCDDLLTMFNYRKYFNTENPFPWMDLMSAQTKTNFFERRVADYSRTGMHQAINSLQKHQRQNHQEQNPQGQNPQGQNPQGQNPQEQNSQELRTQNSEILDDF